MKINRIDLSVKNLEESIKFYEQAFEMKTIKVLETGLGKTASLCCEGLSLTLIQSPKLPIGLLSLGTDIEGEMNEAIEHLKAQGASVVMEPQKLGLGSMAKVFDPNGVSIQVLKVDLEGEDSGARLTHLPHKMK